MDRHELNRMFDGLAPDPQRERELLDGLLQDDVRRQQEMKHIKKVIAAWAAAALLVTGAAAAAPGFSESLLDYLGVVPQDVQTVDLLIPGAMAVNIIKEDNGAALHVTQVLRDRTSIMVLADFTLPEGTLESEEVFAENNGFFGGGWCCFLDEAGEEIDLGIYRNYVFNWEILGDDDPLDNHFSMVFTVMLPQGELLTGNAVSMSLPASWLAYSVMDETTGWDVHWVEVCSGDWGCEVPLPQKDIGWEQQVDVPVGELDGARITVEKLYFSPMNLMISLKREGGAAFSQGEGSDDEELRWMSLMDAKNFTLTDRDGNVVSMSSTPLMGFSGMIDDEGSAYMYRLAEIMDPAQLQGGSITFDLSCGSVTIPLDGLQPVEP